MIAVEEPIFPSKGRETNVSEQFITWNSDHACFKFAGFQTNNYTAYDRFRVAKSRPRKNQWKRLDFPQLRLLCHVAKYFLITFLACVAVVNLGKGRGWGGGAGGARLDFRRSVAFSLGIRD